MKLNHKQSSCGSFAIRFFACLILALMVYSPAMAQTEKPAPPLVEKLYNGKWPSEEEGQKLRAELYFQRAIYWSCAVPQNWIHLGCSAGR